MRGPARIVCALALLMGSSLATKASCIDERGRAQARELVSQCLQVSPATHPPCNASNACSLIEEEIARSCKLLGNDQPDFCDDY